MTLLLIEWLFSYDDGIKNAVSSNMQMLFVGFVLIFIYIAAVLGRWNIIEQRVRKVYFFYPRQPQEAESTACLIR